LYTLRIIGPLKWKGFEPVSAGAWVLKIVSFGPTDPSTTPAILPRAQIGQLETKGPVFVGANPLGGWKPLPGIYVSS